jgi:RNA polymerase-associated protein
LHRIELDWYMLLPALESAERREQQGARRLLRESIVASEPLFRMKTWFLSEHFSQLDAAVAPVLWRLPRWGVELPADAQAVERYARRVFSHPAFGASLSGVEREMRA